MSADPQPVASVSRITAHPSRPDPTVSRDTLVRYLDAVRQGLLMIDRAGFVVLASASARHLLSSLNVVLRENVSALSLLRLLRGETRENRHAIIGTLRHTLDRRQPRLISTLR